MILIFVCILSLLHSLGSGLWYYLEKPGGSPFVMMVLYFVFSVILYALKYFYFLSTDKQTGTFRQIHLYSREYGVHCVNLIAMILVAEYTVIDFPLVN